MALTLGLTHPPCGTVRLNGFGYAVFLVVLVAQMTVVRFGDAGDDNRQTDQRTRVFAQVIHGSVPSFDEGNHRCTMDLKKIGLKLSNV